MPRRPAYLVAWMNTKFGVDLRAERTEGQGLVEYALIIVLVSIACITRLATLGGAIGNVISTIAGKLGQSAAAAESRCPAFAFAGHHGIAAISSWRHESQAGHLNGIRTIRASGLGTCELL